MRRVIVTVGVLTSLFGAGQPANATPLTVDYLDPVTGWEWADLTQTDNLSWDAISAVCPQDGLTPCTGDIGAVELSGWTWATVTQVTNLFDNATDLTADQADGFLAVPNSTWAPQFLAAFTQTSDRDVVGWSSTLVVAGQAYTPFITDAPAPGDSDFVSLGGSFTHIANPGRGVWLHRVAAPTPVPEPATLLLFGAGLAAAGARRYRQRQK